MRDDLISRQAAIDIVQDYAEQLQGYIGMPNDSEVYAYARGLLLSIDRNIKALPSAQPDNDRIWGALSKVYNMDGVPDEAKSIVGDVMLELDETSAEPERDIPLKPIADFDRSWGIPRRQAVCPKCDYFLGNWSFFGDGDGKRITYCETCGQAIDWEGWENETD